MEKMKKVLTISFIAIIITIIAISSCFVVTQQNEYTVVRQFGKIVNIVAK